MLHRVTQALSGDGLVTRRLECNTFDFKGLSQQACIANELSSSFLLQSRGCYLHSSLPACAYDYGSDALEIGWLFSDMSSLYQGPAFPHDSRGSSPPGTMNAELGQKARGPQNCKLQNRTEAVHAAAIYATARFRHFREDLACGSGDSAKPTAGADALREATRAECARVRAHSHAIAFARSRASGCWSKRWPEAMEKLRAYVEKLAQHNVSAQDYLYSEVFFKYSAPAISAVFYVNESYSAGGSDQERLLRMSRSRKALARALLVAHGISTLLFAGMANPGSRAPAPLPVLEWRAGSSECWDGRKVVERIRAGLSSATGFGFAAPPLGELGHALESEHYGLQPPPIETTAGHAEGCGSRARLAEVICAHATPRLT
jgi:hypothetical protein